MSNALGHFVSVTNRGFQTTASGNSQQNRITPDWPDTVTREVPPEAFYLFDPESKEWFSPTYQPLNDARSELRIRVRRRRHGHVFRMTKGSIETELTVFVPPDEPCGVYLLTVRNHVGSRPTHLQVRLLFPDRPGRPARIRRAARDPPGRGPARALLHQPPQHLSGPGPAFAAISVAPERTMETIRGRFFGPSRDVAADFVSAASPLSRSPGPAAIGEEFGL